MIETGVLFGNIHSFYDLNLILSAVDIPPAQPKTTYVDIPGADGSIDLTEAHGEVKYSDRTITLTFTMNPMGDLSENAWTEKKTEVSNLLNGRSMKITLDKDDDYYWLGRCAVNSFKSDRRVRQIVVTAQVNPYKYRQTETVIRFPLTETPKTVNIVNSRMSVCPVIECTHDNTKVTFNSTTFTMDAGVYKTVDIMFVMGSNQLSLSGTGTVTFRFREGDL